MQNLEERKRELQKGWIDLLAETGRNYNNGRGFQLIEMIFVQFELSNLYLQFFGLPLQ